MRRKKRGKSGCHSPTLNSIIKVEKALQKFNEIGKYQLWKSLPKKMMYQTLQAILDYLEQSGKIAINGTRIARIGKIPSKNIESNIPGYLT